LICGASAYPREWDYKRFRAIADKVKAILLMDMAHISGLVATGVAANPFEYCDVVTTTTHKSLRGPRGGMIFFKKDFGDFKMGLESKINFSVFPSVQGGPHNNTIAGIAVQLKEVMTPEFKAYSKQIVSNCQSLAKNLVSKGYKLATGGTDNHLILWDLRPQKVTGRKVEHVCDQVAITLNKNSIIGDKSAVSPGGVRVGTPALTSRGFVEKDFDVVAGFLDRVVKLTVKIQEKSGKPMKKFIAACNDKDFPEIKEIREEVETFAEKYYMPGFDIRRFKKTE